MRALDELERFPVSIFSVVMGLAGVALALRAAERHLGLGVGLSLAVTLFATGVFAVLSLLYAVKLTRYRAAVAAEWLHPVKIAFFPTFSIGLILLAATWQPLAPGPARVLALAGAGLHLLLTVVVLSNWMYQTRFEIHHMSPAWFIPVVGNILVPLPGVELLSAETSWFYFSIGLIFWVVLFVIVFYRVVFHSPLPEKLMPTFFIFIAPPAVGFVAYLGLTGTLDAFARVLYYGALFLTLLLLVQLPRFSRIPFSLTWWAYSFPLAAIVVATSLMFSHTGAEPFRVIGYALLALLLVLVGLLVVRTAHATRAHGLALDEA
jgi:tellurite resistance protein